MAITVAAMIAATGATIGAAGASDLDDSVPYPHSRTWKIGKDGLANADSKASANAIKEAATGCLGVVLAAADLGVKGDGSQCDLKDNPRNLFGDFLTLEAGVEANFWQPSANGFRIVDYDTTGFKGYELKGAVGLLKGAPIISASYHAPFDGSSRQRDLLRPGGGSALTGMEQFDVAGSLTRYVDKGTKLLFGKADHGVAPYLLRTIGSFQPSYSFQSFFGQAKAHENIALVGSGAVRQGNVLVSGVSPLNPGQGVDFRTTFETVRASIDLLAGLPRKDDAKGDMAFRVGYFDKTYRRPTVNGQPGLEYFVCGTCGAGSRYLLFDTTFRSRGVGIGFDFSSQGEDWGGGLGIGYDFGVADSVKVTASAINLYPKGVTYFGSRYYAELNYNIAKINTFGKVFGQLKGEIVTHSWIAGSRSFGTWYGDSDMSERVSLALGVKF